MLSEEVICGCGDGIIPDSGALCGNCASIVESQLEDLRAAHSRGRYNVEKTPTGVRICFGHHEKSEPCSWVDYTANTYEGHSK